MYFKGIQSGFINTFSNKPDVRLCLDYKQIPLSHWLMCSSSGRSQIKLRMPLKDQINDREQKIQNRGSKVMNEKSHHSGDILGAYRRVWFSTSMASADIPFL